MAKIPSLSYERVLAALRRLGFVEVRQRGSHIRMEKRFDERTIRITIPAHRPIKRSTLSHILRQAEVPLDDFLAAV